MSDWAWTEEDEAFFKDRYDLMIERIEQIAKDEMPTAKYQDFFQNLACFLLGEETDGRDYLLNVSSYEASEAQLLSFLATEFSVCSIYKKLGRIQELTLYLELFVQVYNCLEEDNLRDAKDTIYWFFHDYSEVFVERQIRERISEEPSQLVKWIQTVDMTDGSYLKDLGWTVDCETIGLSEIYLGKSEDEIQNEAEHVLQTFLESCEETQKGIRQIVELSYSHGMERLVRKVTELIQEHELKVVIPLRTMSSFGDVFDSCFNESKDDLVKNESNAYYLDKAFTARRLEVLRTVLEQHKNQTKSYAGRISLIPRGRQEISSVKSEMIRRDEKQARLWNQYLQSESQILMDMMKGVNNQITVFL